MPPKDRLSLCTTLVSLLLYSGFDLGKKNRAIRYSLTITCSNNNWAKTTEPFTGFSPRAAITKGLFSELQCGNVVQLLTAKS